MKTRKRNEETKKHPGRRSIWGNQAGYEIHKIYKKRIKKYKDGISIGMYRV